MLLVLQYVLVAVAAGMAVGVGNYITEALAFQLCRFLAQRGHMKRFYPGSKKLFVDHPISNIWAVGSPYIILYYIVSRFLGPQLWGKMYISLSPLNVWPFIW